jgi:uncharacterized membrane protein YagU involved in acid resistance
MNFASWALWGFAATVVLTTLSAASQGVGLTRMNVPYLLGSVFTPDRDRAKLVGFVLHVINGWCFSLFYVLVFESLHRATWWLGATIGLVHAAFVLTVVMRLLPGLHPRMANEQHGPSVARQLEPPGFLALHYGVSTPLAVVLSHAVFGIVLGSFYRLAN